MKLLWVKTDFLHPTQRGGQIRTLEMVRRLHRRHEVHYIAFENANQPEGLARAGEYCSKAYPVAHKVPPRRSVAFAGQLVASLGAKLPLSVSRYRSDRMRRELETLAREQRFDRVVCDFVFPAQNVPFLRDAVLFQHNVETLIWRRHAESSNGLKKLYFQLQAERMFRYEAEMCRAARHVVTVSEADARLTEQLFQLKENVSVVATGVDCDYFRTPDPPLPAFCDLMFVGAMDWLPNIDGMGFFVEQIWPRLREKHSGITLGIVGRTPGPETLKWAERDPRIRVTGTVPDVRPYLWGSRVSIVPLRIGGGTRLKIYEAMVAGVPVVSTSIGAEGLPVQHGETIRLGDGVEAFGAECDLLLSREDLRLKQRDTALAWVGANYSWDSVVDAFEEMVLRGGVPVGRGV